MASQSNPKRDVRQALLRLREQLPAHEATLAAEQIRTTLIRYAAAALAELRHAENRSIPTISLYRSVRGEIDVWPCAQSLWEQGWRIVVPKTCVSTRTLSFLPVTPDSQWIAGAYGVPEPLVAGTGAPQRIDQVEINRCEIAVYVVPGVGFSTTGGRLGYGGGYYDRLFAQPDALGRRVGVAYGCQVVDPLPLANHDVYMDEIVTESGVIRCTPAH